MYIFKCNHQDPELMREGNNKGTAVVCFSTAGDKQWTNVSETLVMKKRREKRRS